MLLKNRKRSRITHKGQTMQKHVHENAEMLVFENVSHTFADNSLAVNNVSLKIKKGEFCVLLGPSGSGKTTLLNTVNGMVLPTAGNITLDGVAVIKRNLKSVRDRVGMIHQKLHLVPRLSVMANVLSGLLHTTPDWRVLLKMFPEVDQRRACKLLEKVELKEKHLYRRVSELSGGEQQRVAIARAFMKKPSVVLADEPVASLDPAVSRQVLRLLRSASQGHNTTVLCSLHQVEYALEFADRIVALRKGTVLFDGPPSALSDETLIKIYGVGAGEIKSQSAPDRPVVYENALTTGESVETTLVH
jgi:phosphonate transport system ATP-binding protein